MGALAMKPRKITPEDIAFWDAGRNLSVVKSIMKAPPGMEEEVGDCEVIRCQGLVRVAWVPDDRDEDMGIPEGVTIWTTFTGGMLPTDVVVTRNA